MDEGALAHPKSASIRDPEYLAWLRTRSCVACGWDGGCDPSHHGRHGIGLKPSDHSAVPLCRRCHNHWHSTGKVFGQDHLDRDQTRAWLAKQVAAQRAAFTGDVT